MKKLFLLTIALTLLCTWAYAGVDQGSRPLSLTQKDALSQERTLKMAKEAEGNVDVALKSTAPIENQEITTSSVIAPQPEKPAYTGPANKPDENVILQGGDDCASAAAIAGIPFYMDGTTAGYTNDYDETCPYSGSTSPDVVYSYTPEADIFVDITLCVGQTDYDTKLYIYENECQAPGDGNPPYACNDDDCTAPSGQGWVSALYCVPLYAGNTYYIVVDGYGGDYGPYSIDITECVPPTGACCVDDQCVATNTQDECIGMGGDWYEGETCPDFQCPVSCVECPPDALDEGEACNEDTNGGCNTDPNNPPTTPIACGDTYCGHGWFDGGTRDTDWYLLELTEPATVTVTTMADFDVLMGIIVPNSGNICDNNGTVTYYDLPLACEEGFVSAYLDASVPYVVFVAPQFTNIVSCGDYWVNVECGGAPDGACCVGAECVATNTEEECDAMGGNWYANETCPEFQCPLPLPCWDGVNILWDNGDTDGSNGWSMYQAIGRTILDDFVVPEGGMTITDFHQTYVWNSVPPGSGTDYYLAIWSDVGGAPGEMLGELNTTLVSEVPTGRVWFSRNEAIGNVCIDPVFLDAGTYWVEFTVIGPENCFVMIHSYLTGSECWLKWDDYGYFGPGSGYMGVAVDVNFCLTGDECTTPPGACCDDATGECVENVPVEECQEPLRWGGPYSTCDTMEPPCEEPCPDAEITIEVLTDTWGYETSWELYDENNNLIDAVYGTYANNTYYYHSYCVDAGCYTFYIYDEWGDGIYSPGGYTVSYNGEIICDQMGGGFSGSEETCGPFGDCVGACCVDLECVATNTSSECDAMGGDHYPGQTCPEFECPVGPLDCADAVYENGINDNGNTGVAACHLDIALVAETADDFVLDADASVGAITFWGNFWNPGGFDPSAWYALSLTIYNDGGGIPGGNPASDCSRVGDVAWTHEYAPGEFSWYVDPLGGFQVDVPVDPPLDLTGGVTYWLGVMEHQDYGVSGQCGWMMTNNQTGSPALLYSEYFGFYWGDAYGGIDMAFCLHPAGGGGACGDYVIGDYNCSGTANVADVVDMYSKLKTGLPVYPDCECECTPGNTWPVGGDVNSSCAMNVADVVDLYSKLKTGSPELTPCMDCPPDSWLNPGGDNRPLVVPNLESKVKLKTGSGMD